MDVLYQNDIDGFCLVSSDSDFTRLATRLREAGKQVIGIGEQKTPNAFIAACNRFIYLEILNFEGEDNEISVKSLEYSEDVEDTFQYKSNPKPSQAASRPMTTTFKQIDDDLSRLIYSFTEQLADDSGWAFLGDVGNMLLKTAPSFDPRNYGYSKLSKLIRDLREIEVDERPTSYPNVKHIYIKHK